MRMNVLLAAALLVFCEASASADTQQIEILFDSSRSMLEKAGPQTKLEAAQQALIKLAGEIAPGSNVGLRAFGTAPVTGNVRESCFDSKLLIPIGPYSSVAMVRQVTGFQANGQTPLGYSLELAGKDFDLSPEVQKTIVLISDGEESCGKDPVAVVKNLQAQGIGVKIHAIGFAVDERTRNQLQQITQLTGGTYKDAKNSAELKSSLEEVTSKENLLTPKTAEKPAEDPAAKEMLLKAERGSMENLLSAAAGARILSSTNEEAALAIDGSEENYAALTAGDQTVIAFKDNQPVLLEGFAIPVSEQQDANPKQIQLSGSLESPQSGFFPIASLKFKNAVDFKSVYQKIKIEPPAAVRYLKVTAGPSFGSDFAEHVEWHAYGKFLTEEEFKSSLSGRPEREQNLIAREAGGKIAAASADGFEPLIDGSGEEAGEEDVTLDKDSEMVFSFAEDKTAYLTKFAVPVYESSESNCKGFEILVSQDSPAAGFKSLGIYETANMLIQGKPFQSFAFPGSVKARYVKLKIVSDHGGNDYCYAREVQIFGTFSLPQGAKEFVPAEAPAAAAITEESPREEEAEKPAAEAPAPEEPAAENSPEKTEDADQLENSQTQQNEETREDKEAAAPRNEELEDYPAAEPMP